MATHASHPPNLIKEIEPETKLTESDHEDNTTYLTSNPETGEKRAVTKKQWYGENLSESGWITPADMPREKKIADKK